MLEKRPTEMIKGYKLDQELEGELEGEAKGNLIINVTHVTGCYLQGRGLTVMPVPSEERSRKRDELQNRKQG